MSPIPSRLILALVAVALAGLSGCATQEAVSQQTDPLKVQVARLDEALQASAGSASQTREQLAAAEARERSLSSRTEQAIADIQALRDRLLSQEARALATTESSATVTGALSEQLSGVNQRLESLASLARELAARGDAGEARLASASAALADTAEQLAQTGKRLDELTEQQQAAASDMAEHRAQTGQRLAELTAQQQAAASDMAEHRAQTGQRLDELTAQQQAATTGTTELRNDLAALAAGSLALTERVAQSERGLDALAVSLPERMARLETRMDDLARLTRSAMEMAAQNDIRSNGKVAFTTVLTEDRTLYPLNLQVVGPLDRTALDKMAQRIKTLNKDYHLEIQGHTDNNSADDFNYQLGKARAEVIKRYLHENNGIPLGWMSVISYGATQPLDGQASSNRRIVIQTLVLDSEK
jgi:outer membrane protein OmpA-like peptidoglycan-associated protein